MKKTRHNYQGYLNDLGGSLPEDCFIIGGKMRNMMYGDALRKYDAIGFEVGFNEWKKNYSNEN